MPKVTQLIKGENRAHSPGLSSRKVMLLTSLFPAPFPLEFMVLLRFNAQCKICPLQCTAQASAPSHNRHSTLVSMTLTPLGTSWTWDHTECVLWCLHYSLTVISSRLARGVACARMSFFARLNDTPAQGQTASCFPTHPDGHRIAPTALGSCD